MRVDQPIPFIGPSYVSRSVSVDAQRSINLYPEIVESGDGKNKAVLYGTPGKVVFTTLPTTPLRGMWEVQGRAFAASGNALYEIFSDGTYVSRGALNSYVGYVSFSDNEDELNLVDGNNSYILNLHSNSYNQNPTGFLRSRTVSFLDGYFIYVHPDTREFYLSNLNDGLTFTATDLATKEGGSDKLAATAIANRQLYLFGERTTEVWYDTGALDFPFSPVSGVFVETGCVAPFSICKMDNTLFWVGRDKLGDRIVYQFKGYTPVRVSTHAIEKILQDMGDAENLNGYVYQEEGHTFYVINHPDAETTVVFDAATQLWHERQSYNAGTGTLTRDRGGFFTFAFGKRLIGDFEDGRIYQSDLDFYSEAGQPIHRIRRAPHISDNLNRLFFDFFQVDIEAGIGLDGTAQGTDPQMMMRYSNDGGRTWSNERTASMGKLGEYKRRAFWNQLGQGRDRVYEVKITDPVKVVLIDAKIGVTPGRN